MSRSFKKTPIYKSKCHNSKKDKRRANKKVRRYGEFIPEGKAYRKVYES